MELIAGGASIAGLLSLTGQCVSGAQKLTSLYQDISNVSRTADIFIKDINSLLRTLHDVQCLLQRIQNESQHAFDDLHLTTLKLQLEDCNQDISSWIATARVHQPSGRGTRARFKDFWTAVNKDRLKNVGSEIQKRRAEIGVALSALGRSFDCQLAFTAAKIDKNVQNLADLTPSCLARLEALSRSISDSIGSLNTPQLVLSSASGVSRNSNADSASQNKWNKSAAWSCNQWSDWDDLFGPVESAADGSPAKECSLCGLLFAEPPQWDIRMHHMRGFHRLGRCRPMQGVFPTLRYFTEHLRVTHEAIIDTRLRTFLGACESRTEDFRTRLSTAIEPDIDAVRDHDSDFENFPRNGLMSSSWDAGLLTEWNSARDRINRWILHALGADDKQADIHRKFYSELQIGDKFESLNQRTWSRLVIKFWFLDEAAIEPNDAVAKKVETSAPNHVTSSILGVSQASPNSLQRRLGTSGSSSEATSE